MGKNTIKNSRKNFYRTYFRQFLFICSFFFFMGNTIPALAQHLRFVIGKYECLNDSDCSENAYCLESENICITCPSPKIPNGQTCVCPDNTHPYLSDCIACDDLTEIWTGQACVCDESRHYYPLNNTCIHCEEPAIYWDNEQCVACRDSKDCHENNFCDNHTCKQCPGNLIRPQETNICHCPENMGETTQKDNEPICLKYCPEGYLKTGIIFFIDKSGSTRTNNIYPYIDSALQALSVPTETESAIYYDSGGGQTTVYNPVPFGTHTYSELSYYFSYKNRGFRDTPDGTTFQPAITSVYNHICDGRKLILILWTDADTLSDINTSIQRIQDIKQACPGSQFYLIAPQNQFSSVTDAYFSIYSLPSSYTNILNQEITDEICIEKTND